jgi:hypothetical protein
VELDDITALSLVADLISPARTQHIDIISYHVRQRVQMQRMKFKGIPTRSNPADLFTKPLVATLFEVYRSTLGVHPSQ